jgi:putative DNA primase/helicase
MLDAHPFKVNAGNGVIDLEAGELQDHDAKLFFTKILPWSVDADMETPHWDKFLDEITGGDAGLVAYLQQIAGYCLTGSVREQCFFIFWVDVHQNITRAPGTMGGADAGRYIYYPQGEQ